MDEDAEPHRDGSAWDLKVNDDYNPLNVWDKRIEHAVSTTNVTTLFYLTKERLTKD